MRITDMIPSIGWIKGYSNTDLRGDLSAGLTVGVMLIPQGMAYAMIAGLPPIYGLYASTIPLIIYAMFGTSRHLAVGPVAMVSLLTAAGVGAIASVGTEEYLMLAFILAFLVGAIQLAAGVFRLGFLVNFLSHPVISGFTSAAALIIGLSQLKHLLGINLPRSHHVHEIVMSAIERITEINLLTFGIGLGGIVLIIGLKRINKMIPGALVAVVAGILVVRLFNLQDHGVAIVGTIPEGIPGLALPRLNQGDLLSLLPTALTIALVGLMESIAVAKAIEQKYKTYKVIPNKELIALGLSNLGASVFQGYPVTGGFSRTAVNEQAGARTGLASVISAVLIVITLLFLTPLFYFLPNAILASVIMVAVFGLIDFKEPMYLIRANKFDLGVLLVTFIATLTLGIELGIGVGVILSLLIVVFRSTAPHIAILGNVPGTRFYRNKERFEDIIERPDLLIIRFDAALYFANVNYFKASIDELVETRKENIKGIILDASSINSIDSTGVHALKDLASECKTNGLKFYVTGVRGPVRDAMQRGSLTRVVGNENLFMHVFEAVSWHDSKADITDKTSLDPYVLQTNEEIDNE